MLIFGKTDAWLQIPIIGIVFVVVIYNIFISDKTENMFVDNHAEKMEEEISHTQTNDNIDVTNSEGMSLESGYYDSNNELAIGKYKKPKFIKNKVKTKYSYDKMSEYNKATCKLPTIDNPFMNPNLNDTLLEDPPEACNVDDEKISNKIADAFNADLYRDIGELFDVKNSQRQFYTVPVPSNPPDTVGLANWLYKGASACQSSQAACYNYEDLTRRNNLI